MPDPRVAGARRIHGDPALIFERLAQPSDGRGAEGGIARIHDTQSLRDSVLAQLRSLLNTRVALDIETLEERERTTIDYGIPDLSAFPVGNSDAMARLSRHISRTIAVYEPRLRVHAVTMEPSPGGRSRMVARVSGSIEIGVVVEPVSFAIAVGAAPGETDDG